MGARKRFAVPAPAIPESKDAPMIFTPPTQGAQRTVLILPNNASSSTRFLTLTNPATMRRCRYYFCPSRGLYELTRISAAKTDPKSWLLMPSISQPTFHDTESASTNPDAALMISTPYDPLFLLLTALAPSFELSSSEKPSHFLPFSDYLDTLRSLSPQVQYLIHSEKFSALLASRLQCISDHVEVGDERMYRLSIGKLLSELLSKAKKMVENGLPRSLEDRFVRRVLEPLAVLDINVEEEEQCHPDAPSLTPGESMTDKSEPETPNTCGDLDSQSNSLAKSTAASNSQSNVEHLSRSSYASTSPHAPLLRLRVALHYILRSYVPPTLQKLLLDHLDTTGTPSFTALDTYLADLTSQRRAALASRSLNDLNRKRNAEDFESGESRAEKKAKVEAEEARKKAGMSRGVKDLKKADLTGMKKLSSFFTKTGGKNK